MTFATWSQTAASNTSVGGISTDGNVTLVNQIDNMFRGMMAELAVARDDGTVNATGPRGYIHGLITSNNAGDATNDIDIAAGECTTKDSPYWRMALASALTKRLDAAWAVGTGNGGLDTGAIANTTYHIWLIQRSDTLVVDALFSTSATAPTMPANYDRKQLIWSIVRSGGAILPYRQVVDTCKLNTPITAISGTAGYAALLTSMGVPIGIVCQPTFNTRYQVAANSTGGVFVGDAGIGGIDTGVAGARTGTAANVSARADTFVSGGIFTNTNGQVYTSMTITGTCDLFDIKTTGWVHPRGQV